MRLFYAGLVAVVVMFLLTMAKVPNVNGQDGWYEYKAIDEEKAKGNALDVSFLLDAPAGKHGHMQAKGDKFYFEDGTEARFWGLNVVASANFPDKETAVWMADSIARIGANLVRFHHLEAPWVSRNIFGPQDVKTTRKLDPENLDKFEYLWAQMKERGIYIYLDVLVTRSGKMPEDGIESPDDVEYGLKIEGEFDPYLIELQKEYINNLMTHTNPYTGTTLAEDPAVVLIDIINEDSLFYLNEDGTSVIKTPYYQGVINGLFNKWLVDKFKDRETLALRWKLAPDEDPVKGTINFPSDYKRSFTGQKLQDAYQFIYDTQYAYYQTMRDHLRSIGVKCPVTGSNHWVVDEADMHVNARMDYLDRHKYWAHPSNGWHYSQQVIVDPRPMVKDGTAGIIGELSQMRAFGKPYVISEWQNCCPNEYRVEGELIMAVYACLQNWNPVQFQFSETNAPAVDFGHVLNMYNQPSMIALWPACALLFHRQDVKEADTGMFLRLEPADVIKPYKMLRKNPRLVLAGKTGLMFTDIADDESYNNAELEKTAKANPAVSATGEVSWDTRQGLVTVNTPRSQGLVGFTKKQLVMLEDAEFKVENEFAAVILSSLSNAPIRESDRMLVTAVGDARMNGMVFSGRRLESKGELPVKVEAIEGYVAFKTDTPLTVYKLTASGERDGEVEVKKTAGGYRFFMTADNECMHYEVLKQEGSKE